MQRLIVANAAGAGLLSTSREAGTKHAMALEVLVLPGLGGSNLGRWPAGLALLEALLREARLDHSFKIEPWRDPA
jgi:hypothetical protein